MSKVDWELLAYRVVLALIPALLFGLVCLVK